MYGDHGSAGRDGPRTRTSRTRNRTGTRTSICDNFLNEDGQDGDRDKDGEDVNVLRRPDGDGNKIAFEVSELVQAFFIKEPHFPALAYWFSK